MTTRIGNDVIDLRAAHNRGRADHARLLARVLTANERAQLLADDGGDAGFALLWSAKEAAYKALKKARPTLVFAPGRWQVDCASLRMTDATHHGRVQMDADTCIAVSWQCRPHWLHCVATFGPTPEQLDSAVRTLAESTPQQPFSASELASFSRTESAHVRELARQLLAAHGIHDIEIVRMGDGAAKQPPQVFAAGVPLTHIELSLSHDGDYVAAAIALCAQNHER